MTKKIWTREDIVAMLNTNDRAVERGVVAIWQRQTADEQDSDTTRHSNGIGFSGWSAHSGSYYAKWVESGRRLTGKHLDKARKIALHHVGQLTRIANGEG